MKLARPVAKTAVKSLVKTVARKPATKKVAVNVPAKITIVKKPAVAKLAPKTAQKSAPKVVVGPIMRESFTMTTADQELLKKCKRDAITSGRDSTKKSEIVRAALRHFASLSASTQLMELNGLDPIKTGRPKKK